MSSSTAWIILVIAGVLEFVWATGLKYSEGFTKLGPSILTLITMGISFYLLSLSMRVLPVGISYTVWTGIGAVGAVLVGILIFKEPISATKLVFLGMIITGILGLNADAQDAQTTAFVATGVFAILLVLTLIVVPLAVYIIVPRMLGLHGRFFAKRS